MSTERHVRAGVATILGLIIIPWLISDPHWRNVLLGFVGLYVLYVMTERDEMLQPGKKAIFITGCDTGFGNGMAKFFDRQGFRVYAGCLASEGDGAADLQTSCSENLTVVQLDVTKDEDVKNALQTVKDDLGDRGLWGLVNNAGIYFFSEVEVTPIQMFQQHFDVNCLGKVRMVKAFLPLIKRSKGRIVNFCSIAEMTRNIDSQQKLFDDMKETLSESQIQYYNDAYFKQAMEGTKTLDKLSDNSLAAMAASSDYSSIFSAVDEALLSKKPKARYYVGFGSQLIMATMTHLPSWLLDFLLTRSKMTYREKGLSSDTNLDGNSTF